MVVIIDGNQIAELEMPSSGSGLAGNAFHGTTITEEDIGMVVDEVVARFVEDGTEMSLGNSQTNCVGKALSQRPSGDLDPGGVMCFGMARGDAIDLLFQCQLGPSHWLPVDGWTYSKVLQIVQGDFVAKQMQKCILQHATMAVAAMILSVNLIDEPKDKIWLK